MKGVAARYPQGPSSPRAAVPKDRVRVRFMVGIADLGDSDPQPMKGANIVYNLFV